MLNVMGGCAFIWKQKHNNNHHSYTNIEGMDDDINIKPFIRTNAGQKKYWFHRFQHIYGFLLYGLSYLFWVFYQDFKKYFSRKISRISPLRKMKLKDHILFWVTKCSYVLIFLVIPAYNTGIVNTLLGYSMMVFVCGFVIAIVFQLAHLFEDSEFVIPQNDTLNIENEWAIHQISTTANFATRNKLVSWLCGGLNFQIEHHLFPKISHIHYPQVAKIVRETCSEFNIFYKEFPSVLSAVRSHFIHLRKTGLA
jgi:linoleoyl-CoA desaturase